MVRRTQGLPLNTIVLAIIAIVVLVFLILVFTGGIGKFIGQTSQVTSSNQTSSALCSEYASEIQTQMGTSTNSSAQLEMLANSQYVSSGCSIYFQYSFTLYNGSEVECGLGSNSCITLNSNQGSGGTSGGNGGNGGTSGGNGGNGGSTTGSGSGSSCTPPNGIPGCELQ